MAPRSLANVLGDFQRSLRESSRLANDAYRWSQPLQPGVRPQISQKRRHAITELAFLTSFLAWEIFLEHSFILYLMGKGAPRGPAPVRYAFPPSLSAAIDWVAEGKEYAQWTSPPHVRGRAERFFRNGRPFAVALRSNQNVLEEAQIIRNAIAHKSANAQKKVERIVRARMGGVLPPNITTGKFLGTTVPGSAPPISFLDFYLERLESCAVQIVPS